tara:strand:+ start:68 stop:544 length:477 start_codon:yes stop_codon:yes gene_type:complete
MSSGYIYCFSNKSMPSILKIGMTVRTPEIRLNEANTTNTWNPPTPYKIEFAKRVYNSKQKKAALHELLTKFTERIHPKRDFFRVEPKEVRKSFDLMEGDYYGETDNKYYDETDDETDDDIEDDIYDETEEEIEEKIEDDCDLPIIHNNLYLNNSQYTY